MRDSRLFLLVVSASTDSEATNWCADHPELKAEIVIPNGRSLASISNPYLEKEYEVLGFCHADVTFGDGAVRNLYEAAKAGALAGIAGVYVWPDGTGQECIPGMCQELIPQKVYRWGRFEPGRRPYCWNSVADGPGQVSTLDNCCVFLRPDLGLRFDAETFDGYHCHVPDICLQGAQVGIRSIVPAAIAWHKGTSTRGLDWASWQAEFQKYRGRLHEKWKHVPFEFVIT